MKKRTLAILSTLAAVSLGLVGALPAQASVPRSQTYTIQGASHTPVDVGKVSPGHPLTVSATGTVVYYPGCGYVAADGTFIPDDAYCSSTPDGPGPLANVYPSRFSPCEACDGYAPLGSLIGRLGTSGTWFLVGSQKTITTSRPTDLYLEYNDFNGSWVNGVWVPSDVQYADNVGAFTAVVTR